MRFDVKPQVKNSGLFFARKRNREKIAQKLVTLVCHFFFSLLFPRLTELLIPQFSNHFTKLHRKHYEKDSLARLGSRNVGVCARSDCRRKAVVLP